MTTQIELHGKVDCPFAWRTRLCAYEKGVRFDYVVLDGHEPGRVLRDNPERRSPLLVHGAFRLTESGVIALYLEEAFPGRPLLPGEATERARQRVNGLELSKLEADPHAGPLTPEARAGVLAGYELLERKLADGRSWIGGHEPMLVDLLLWPHLIGLTRVLQLPPPAGLARVAAYFERIGARESLLQTRPAWAR